MEDKSITVIIAEDHQLYSDMLVNTLEGSEIRCLAQARNGFELIKHLQKNILPDIVLLDLSMPELDGNATLNVLLHQYPEIKVIIISQYEDMFVVNNYFERGVKAFIPKSQHVEQLVSAIEAVAAGSVYRENFSKLNSSSPASRKKVARFTQRELDTIKLIIDGKTNREIADVLCVSIKTVELDRTRIYEKANVKTLSEFIRFVNSAGWYYMEGT